jgi:hypothetical protein
VIKTIHDVTESLRRDDLAPLFGSDVDVLDVVDAPWGQRGMHDSDDVVLVCFLSDLRAEFPFQAIQRVDDWDPDQGASYVYIPLDHGPVQQTVYVCPLCRSSVSELFHFNATMLGIPVRMFCASCRSDLVGDLGREASRLS